MNTLHFEKISQYDRPAEPVTVSIPFSPGRLDDPGKLVIRDGGRAVPAQTRQLARWPDESVKWLLVHFQADLPGNAEATLTFEIADRPEAAAPPSPVTAAEDDDGVVIDTGVLSFRVPRLGYLPISHVRLDGRAVFGDRPFGGFRCGADGSGLSTECGEVTLEVEEAGPVRAVVLVRGAHRDPAGGGVLELRGRVTAHAGKGYVEVEHQFVHTGEQEELALESLLLEFAPAGGRGPSFAVGEGYYGTRVQRGRGPSAAPVTETINAETVLYQSWEHFPDSFYGDFWADWTGEEAGLTISIHQAHQNFPKALRAGPGGLTCWLYPPTEPPARVIRGMARTHRMQLHVHPADEPGESISARSLQFQLPDRPSLSRQWLADNNPWCEAFFPQHLPDRLMTYLARMHDSRPKALGMMHFGDAPDAGYTNQGRGRGQTVWVNNEYDRTHAATLFYGLTGARRALDSALVSARHWLDVDLCHFSPDELTCGGLRLHAACHAGRATPSHEWVEGLLDYYFLTGRREGLDAAVSVAENILCHTARPELRRPGAAAVREVGWALRAMVGMFVGTGEGRWAGEARRLADLLVDWRGRHGALLAPYTSHSMPRVPFMIALTVNSLARYLHVEDRPDIRELIVQTVDDLLAHCLGPDGVFYYKELPSLRRVAPTVHAIEALTHAYRISGQRRYLEAANRQFAAFVDGGGGVGSAVGGTGAKRVDDSGAVISGRGGGRAFASCYTSILIFAAEATPLGLLDWFEYPS